MRSSVLIPLAAVLVWVAGWFAFTFQASGPDAAPQVRTLRYVLAVRNTSGAVLDPVTVHMYAPADLAPLQRLEGLDVSVPFELHADAAGNRVAELHLGTLAPFATAVVRVEARLVLATEASRQAWGDRVALVAPEPGLEVHAEEIRSRASALRHAGLPGIAAWVRSHMEPEPYVVRDLGALHALRTGRGDCTEYTYLAAALARANGIPTRQVAGFVLDGDRAVATRTYHNWLYAQEGGRWRLLDPLAGMLDEGYGDYVVFRVLDPGAAAPLSTSQRFFAHDERVVVRLSGV